MLLAANKRVFTLVLCAFGLLHCKQEKKQEEEKEGGQATQVRSGTSTGVNTGTGTDNVSGDRSGGITKAFLKPSDFDGSDFSEISASEISDKVNKTSGFYADVPDSTSEKACNSKYDNLKLAVSGSGSDTLTISEEIDLKDCLQKDATGDIKYTKATLKFYAIMRCEGVSLKSFQGKSIKEFNDSDETPCAKAKKDAQVLSNTEYTLTMTTGGKTNEISARSAEMSASGDVCLQKFKSAAYTISDCIKYDSSEMSDGTKSLSVLKAKNLVLADNETYYRSGSMDVKLSNWSGTMTYTGAKTKPKWSLKSGKTTKTGTFSGSSSSLKLAGSEGLELPELPRFSP